ncbi:porin [Vibrio profundum]|uniref:porin n=1 Tax=Vibrio profundum TaxID=2910247 RepID=UPI003D14017F
MMMRKTLIAMAVLAAAGTANAAQIYGSDTAKVSLKGEIDTYISSWERDDTATTQTKGDPDVNMWAKIQMDAEHQINGTFTAFGSFEMENGSWWNGTVSAISTDDLYAGVKTSSWGVVAGEHGDWANSMKALEKDDIDNDAYYLGTAGGHHRESTGHGIGFKFYGVEGLTVVADVTTNSDEDIDPTWGTSVNYSLENYNLAVAYQVGETASGVASATGQYKATDYHKGGVSASATFGGLYLALTYVNYEGVDTFGFFGPTTAKGSTIADDTFYEGNAFGGAASFTVDKLRLYTTYSLMSNDKATLVTTTSSTTSDVNDADNSLLVVGADYGVLDNLTVFVEYQNSTAEAGLNTSAVDLDAYSFVLGSYYSF